MKDIKELLKKYLSVELQDRELIEAFIDVVSNVYFIDLYKKDFKIEKDKIILKIKKPKEKSFLLINKTSIINELNNRGFIISDIV